MAASAYTLKQLAEHLQCEYLGEPEVEVCGIASLDRAQSHQLTFLAQEKYAKLLPECKAGIVMLQAKWRDRITGNALLVEDPYLAYAQVSGLFDPRPKGRVGIHSTAQVDPTARIAESASIGPNCVIGPGASIGEDSEISPGCVVGANSSIGKSCYLCANVSIYHDVKIGDACVIHSGTVIGSDGFGFAPSKNGWVKIYQLGGVSVGSGVEIGANTAIDRGALNDTVIEDGVIIDNQVHIAHNVRIGEGTAIAGCVGIAGSATIGKHCTIGGAVAIGGHLTIADNSHFHGGTIVTKGNSKPGAFASAAPLQEVTQWRRNSIRYKQLDKLAQRVSDLEKGDN